ncbi:hypothetical protein EC970264_3299 [Escherichia coli 97.0264]|nr:hypothetical protein EC970264_3299 [Escherichia coli 97.0264]
MKKFYFADVLFYLATLIHIFYRSLQPIVNLFIDSFYLSKL